ncbi:MAG: hypothetical protein GY847_12105 [Proteobacteria bacterium]|nr:hypothetical protein [Pseudomonadota bacterium]
MNTTDKIDITRLYTGEDGLSHFRNEVLDNSIKVSSSEFVTFVSNHDSVFFYTFTPDHGTDWHNASIPCYFVYLSGEQEITTADNITRRFGPGDILLVEDMTGKGHKSKAVGNQACKVIVVRLKPKKNL